MSDSGRVRGDRKQGGRERRSDVEEMIVCCRVWCDGRRKRPRGEHAATNRKGEKKKRKIDSQLTYLWWNVSFSCTHVFCRHNSTNLGGVCVHEDVCRVPLRSQLNTLLTCQLGRHTFTHAPCWCSNHTCPATHAADCNEASGALDDSQMCDCCRSYCIVMRIYQTSLHQTKQRRRKKTSWDDRWWDVEVELEEHSQSSKAERWIKVI